jgi:hypothetical protein
MLMTESGDEAHILRLATTSLPSLGPGRLHGIHLLDAGWRESGSGAGLSDRARSDLEERLETIGAASGEVAGLGGGWGWAFALRGLEGHYGHVVVGAEGEPTSSEQFLLTVLVQQTGVALANARLHARERATAQELQTANAVLAETVAVLEPRTEVHERLTGVAASGEELVGIAQAVHELTGYPAAVEDHHGNLRAWAGPGRPAPYPKDTASSREGMLRRAHREGGTLRTSKGLTALARQGEHVVGVLVLVDHDGTAGDQERMTLEYGATVLALELARRTAWQRSSSGSGATWWRSYSRGPTTRARSRGRAPSDTTSTCTAAP